MAAPSFDLLIFGRQKLAGTGGSSPSHHTLTKLRLRIVQQVFNNRRLVYRNRVETNRQNLLLSTIESAHHREEATQRLQKHQILTDLKQKHEKIADSCLTLLPSYEPIDLTEPKDFYRFGVRVQSAIPHVRSRPPNIRSNLSRPTQENISSRAKSASAIARPFTAPLHQTVFTDESIVHVDTDSDDDDDEEEVFPVSDSRLTSGKLQHSSDGLASAVSSSIHSHHSSDLSSNRHNLRTSNLPLSPSSNHRITWPVKLKVFALQDEDDSRQQYLAWYADQRKTKAKRTSKQFFDLDLEKKYQEAVRRRKEIDAFVTPQLIEEHQRNDPIFAKRYRQLKLAVRAGKVPTYDPTDHEIHSTMNKSKIERTRTALITAKQTKMKNVYRNQQKINDAHLSKRVDTFLKRLAKFKEKQAEEEG